MVGTAEYQVGAESRIQPKKRLTSQPGVQTTPPPAASDVITVAIRPWPWNSGRTFRQRSASLSASAATALKAEVQILTCVSGTIFGRDVVPDVNKNSAVVPGPTGSDDGSFAAAPASVNRPAASPVGVRSNTGTPRACATRRAGESTLAARTNARGFKSARYRSNSSAE